MSKVKSEKLKKFRAKFGTFTEIHYLCPQNIGNWDYYDNNRVKNIHCS